MRTLVIGRADRMGLGSMTEDFCHAMQPDRTILVNWADRVGLDVARFKNSTMVTRHEWSNNVADVIDYALRDIDLAVGFELFYHEQFTEIAKARGVTTCMFPMWEWSPESVRRSDLLVNLSETDQQTYPQGVRMDWPASPLVHTPDRVFNWPPKTFVHLAGNASHNREGTREVIAAASFLRGTGAKLIVYSNFSLVAEQAATDPTTPIEFRGSVSSRRELLREADCMVCPRGLPGHSLPINEATGEEIPCIVLDLLDWKAWPYRLDSYSTGPTFLRGLGGNHYLSQVDVRQLGQAMRDMAGGLVDLKPCPKLPTWDEFKTQFNTLLQPILL